MASGPLTDSQGGALIVVRFDGDDTQVADVIQLMNDDPFYQQGCLRGRSFREWNPVKARF